MLVFIFSSERFDRLKLLPNFLLERPDLLFHWLHGIALETMIINKLNCYRFELTNQAIYIDERFETVYHLVMTRAVADYQAIDSVK